MDAVKSQHSRDSWLESQSAQEFQGRSAGVSEGPYLQLSALGQHRFRVIVHAPRPARSLLRGREDFVSFYVLFAHPRSFLITAR